MICSFKQLATSNAATSNQVIWLKQVVEDIVWQQRKSWQHENLMISFDAKDDFQVRSCAEAIKQIIDALVDNSVQHGFSGKSAWGDILICLPR